MNNCTTGSCPVTQSDDYRVIKPMPEPTEADMDDRWFNIVWDTIRGMKIACPEYYQGWQIATGEHVKLITNMIKEVK